MLVSIQSSTAELPENDSTQRIEHLPVLVVDLHSRCQCKCVMCDIWQQKKHEELPLALIEQNRDAIRRLLVEWVVFTGGEPLMHSRFREVCEFFRSEGIRITLLTAGLSLAKHVTDVAAGVDDVIVSLDGPRKVHDGVRGIPGAFDLLATGILSLLSRRPEMQVRARTTVQKANHALLRATVETAQELDLSGISFLATDLTSTAFNRENPWSEGRQSNIALNEGEIAVLEAEVSNLIAQYGRQIANGYIAESPSKLRRIVEHFRAHLGRGAHRAPLCNAPWVSAVLEHNGSVRPCFFHAPVGNLAQENLDEAINNHSSLTFRRALDVEANAICRQCVCSLHRSNGDQS